MSDVSSVIGDLGEWIKTGKEPASLSDDARKLLGDVEKAAAFVVGVGPDVPGIVAQAGAFIAAITAVAAARGLDLPEDYVLFVTIKNLAAGLEAAYADGKMHAALISAKGQG